MGEAEGRWRTVVKLLIKLHVVVRVEVQHAVSAVGLVNVVDVVEAIGAKVLQHEIAHSIDRRLLDEAAQVHDHIEAIAATVGGGRFTRHDAPEDGELIGRCCHKVGGHVLDKHVGVLPLEAGDALLELRCGECLARVRVKGAVNHVGDHILPLATNVRKGGVVVDEGRAGESDAVKVEDDVDRVDGA